MNRFKPDVYQKNIYNINYNKLKEKGIKCLIYDLDNTLGLIEHKMCPDETKKLINKLKKDFIIVICSNNNTKRLIPYMEDLGIDGVSWSLKPLTRGLKIIRKKYNLKKEEMCIIGDQMVTDILSGNLYKIKTILVDPLGKKDLKVTFFNRIVENQILKKYKKSGTFERGKYYE